MRTTGKLIALFDGSQMLLGRIGMALFCYLSPSAFPDASKDSGIALRFTLLTTGLVPQIGWDLLLVWQGLPSRSRMRA